MNGNGNGHGNLNLNGNGNGNFSHNWSTASTSSFSGGQGQQGKYVIRLTNLEEENVELKSRVADLERWKERMEAWMEDQFGVPMNGEFDDGSVTSEETVSVVQNNSSQNGSSPPNIRIIKVESFSPQKNSGHSESLEFAETVNRQDQQNTNEDDSYPSDSESNSEMPIPAAPNQNAPVSDFKPLTENRVSVEASTSGRPISKKRPEPESAVKPSDPSVSVPSGTGGEDDDPCDVCASPDPEDNNEMLYCDGDGCKVCVHQACYGISKLPDKGESWKCRTCSEGIAAGTQPCLFCPKLGGAMTRCKSPSNRQWAHVSCAWWIPEISFGDPTLMEPVINIPEIPLSRWKLICKLCKIKKGAPIQCYYKKCAFAFHVTCAHKNGLKMSMYDEDVTSETNGVPNPNTLQMRAFCKTHTNTNCETPSPSPKRRRIDTPTSRSK